MTFTIDRLIFYYQKLVTIIYTKCSKGISRDVAGAAAYSVSTQKS